jgi:hypothetical protein
MLGIDVLAHCGYFPASNLHERVVFLVVDSTFPKFGMRKVFLHIDASRDGFIKDKHHEMDRPFVEMEVGTYGWMSVFVDPTGATLALWHSKSPQQQS